MPVFEERGLKFSFPDTWNVVQYDKAPFYKDRIMPLQQAKAVDFLCCDNTKLIVVESKRYKEKALEDVDELIQKVSLQFKDTIFGLVSAYVSNDNSLEVYYEVFLTQPYGSHHKIELYIDLEHENHLLTKESIYAQILKKLKIVFANFGFAVRVLHSQNMQNHPWKAEVL
ncbi:hypothetical protein [Desulfovibrio sp. 86]|uniref:Uncharacterized protein n=1 Tax=uncultured Desulfovibrio sp. TaxID=167968 RepID=A0A212KXD5_9BACT|nr:hypothetical protein [Desulfovibrio sp. 86]SCM69930.1 hypothetical protein KL86DES1_10053 [uncultured Desulfovibrio sp.]VZH35266.1 conserved protein of unknown function [Desulfovibrio sp. 86]